MDAAVVVLDASRSDAAQPTDASVAADAAGVPDASAAADAAQPADAAIPPDAATIPDASNPPDAASAPDAATTPDAHVTVDASAPLDAASVVDASEPPDAASSTDAGLPEGTNVLLNGSFEEWQGPLPVSWMGDQTNITIDNVLAYTASAHDGAKACQLINTSTTHKRFTSRPMSARAGRYQCTYWTRGHGEIRNARFDTDFSSYSSYTLVNSADWQRLHYDFTLTADVFDTFELIFSVRSTQEDREHLQIDDVFCVRLPQPCDEVVCDPWAKCNNTTVQCEALPGRCVDNVDCPSWAECGSDHFCQPLPDRCTETIHCSDTPDTPVCNTVTHSCEPGDPCAGVTCEAWRECSPTSGTCVLRDGYCHTTADCTAALPACDTTTHLCEAVNHPSNIIPNGGFETWSEFQVPYQGPFLLPDSWYGLDIPGSTEVLARNVLKYTTHVHSGSAACQLVVTGIAERFTSEALDIPLGKYTCAYWVRGKGVMRHRYYSTAGWSVYTDFVTVDSETWMPITFKIDGNVRDWRLILYPGSSDPARDHVQVDDVVCTLDGP